MRKTYKKLQNMGKHFTIYNTSQTGILTIYKFAGNTYAKTRDAGASVNGVENLVICKHVVIGVKNAFIQI